MKKLAIIGGIGMMTMAGTNMIWHKQKPSFNPNTLAIASGAFIVSIGITIKYELCVTIVRADFAHGVKYKKGKS